MIQVLCEVIMVRWTEQLPHLKWLRPGMGVKRWVVLLIVGLALLAMAVAAASKAVAFSGLWTQVQRLHLHQINPALEALLLFIAGSVLIAWAFYGLNHSILSAFRPSRTLQAACVSASAALMLERLMWSRLEPSMRTSLVSPSRLGEWTTPTS